jgi:hypothetical protein
VAAADEEDARDTEGTAGNPNRRAIVSAVARRCASSLA